MLKQSTPIHQSSINSFLNCPLNYRYRYIDGLTQESMHPAAINGSTLHKLIERMHAGEWEIDIAEEFERVYRLFEAESIEKGSPVLYADDPEKTFTGFVKDAVEILESYRQDENNRNVEVLLSEAPFRMTYAGHEFAGIIDQVRRNPDGTVELIDFKSNKQPPQKHALVMDYQLLLYMLALKHGEVLIGDEWVELNLQVDYTSWYFLRYLMKRKRTTVNGQAGEQFGDPLFRIQRSLMDVRRARMQIKGILRLMATGVYPANPHFCQICSFKQTCLGSVNDMIIPKHETKIKKGMKYGT
jgi:RecB family exonuclease